MQTPFSLRIFVADGDPDGLRIVDKSNWIGKALVFPRALLPRHRALSHLKTESCKFPLPIKHLASQPCWAMAVRRLLRGGFQGFVAYHTRIRKT